MAKYQIWDKKSQVITPIGEVLSPEEWISRYPMAGVDGIDLVIAAGTINGAFCAEYTSLVDTYTKAGCDFTDCVEKEDFLEAIEVFEDLRMEEAASAVSTDERIASALEAQVMMSMDDVTEE